MSDRVCRAVSVLVVGALAATLALAQSSQAAADSAGRGGGRVSGAGLGDPGVVQPLDARQVTPRLGGESAADGAAKTLQQPSLPVVRLEKEYRLSPNDLIEVEVLDAENLRRTARVNFTGTIALPLIGQVVVGGLTSEEAEAAIAAKYREKYLQNPQVSIFIKEFTVERITVEGAVTRPGIFPMSGQLTLLRVLAMAGGFASIANSNEVMLYRTNEQRKREVFVFDVEQIRAGKAEDPPIKGDDLIVVQRDGARRALKDSLFRDIIDSINPFSVLVPH